MSISSTGIVPFLDLGRSFDDIREDVLADVADALERAAFVNGPAVLEFEAAFARACGTEHCIGMSSGLDALRLALQASGVGPGDEVVVPAATFVATWEAVSQVGATPVPVDVSETDYCIDAGAAAAAFGERTRAIVPVHLYGQMADPAGLDKLASSDGPTVIEDACQAHGAARRGRRAGSVGTAAAFSFYPSKNLGAIGDAGALVTSDGALAERVRALREHGQRRKYEHTWIGWTARLDAIQAAVLLRKLPFLERWNDDRRRAATWYGQALEGMGDLVLPEVGEASIPVWHVYVVRTADPVGLGTFLRERGVETGRHYPEPIHLSEAYRALGHRPGAFPVAEALARECLSLPMFPGISEDQLERVARAIESWFADG
jgi:dTDP-4-amino-4,6-dideoxygalactose transaminase